MEKIRVAVVGLGHRGRHMARLVEDAFNACATVVAACDVDPELWHVTQWLQTQPMKEILPNANIHITRAGCTISSHCGRNTLGVLFIRKEPIA